MKNTPVKYHENNKLKTMNEILKTNQSQMTHASASQLTKTFSPDKSTNQLKTKVKNNMTFFL
jgi:hypothetical protein